MIAFFELQPTRFLSHEFIRTDKTRTGRFTLTANSVGSAQPLIRHKSNPMEKIKISVGSALVFQLSLTGASDNIDLNFYDATRKNAVFHMVLRKAQNILVFNTLEEGQWGQEIIHPWTNNEQSSTLLRLRFAEEQIEVGIGEQQYIFELRDGHGSDQICHMLHAPEVTQYCRMIGDREVFWETTLAGHSEELADGESLLKLSPLQGFTLSGSIHGPASINADYRVICNDQEIEAPLILTPRSDEKADPEDSEMAFQIELPGYIWSLGKLDAPYLLQLEINGTRYPRFPYALDVSDSAEWFEELAKRGPTEDCYWPLLALEHWRFTRKAVELSENAVAFLTQTATAYKLDDYLLEDESSSAEEEPAAKIKLVRKAQPLDWQLHKQALEEFNRQLPSYRGREDELLDSLMRNGRMTAERELHLVEAVAHYFMWIDRFDVVRHRLPPARIHAMANSYSTWSVPLSLPFLVASGEMELALNALRRLPTLTGWLETAGIATACKLVRAQLHQNVRMEDCEQFLYALIVLLDHLRTDYWSRLHDQYLIEALLGWLETPERWNHWLRHDLEKAALRCFGLSPSFWKGFKALPATSTASLEMLQHAAGRFERLVGHIRTSENWTIKTSGKGAQKRQALTQAEREMHEDLNFFRAHDNVEATVALREVASNLLLTCPPGAPQAIPTGLLQDLTFLHPSEAIRIAAMPLDSSIVAKTTPPDLRSALERQYDDIGHSPLYKLQKQAMQHLKDLEKHQHDRNGKTQEAILEKLLQSCQGLQGAESQGLGIDILVSASQLLPEAVSAKHGLDRIIGEMVADALKLFGKEALPPQPLLAALSKLRLFHRNSGMYPQIAAAIEQHFTALAEQTPTRAKLSDSAASLSHASTSDTLVVVYSCRPYLDSRIAAIRATWLQSLTARNIPYVVMVGDGNDELDEDLLALNVPDRYEDLPRKTLKLIEWVLENTDFEYVLKIDDDCYLNVDEYFDSASYRKAHYYGRALYRKHKGETDRSWHHAKSQGTRAMSALDKSPEPSAYADGGSGYCLSRFAMQSIANAMKTTTGKRLAASSFMEDKLVGDLLAQTYIYPSNEDYFTLVRRRLYREALPVNIWNNNFYPSQKSPCKVAHLDTAEHMFIAREHEKSAEIWPKKIWASYESPKIGPNGNQLELITPLEKVTALLAHDLVVVAAMRNEMIMLPHFLAHYRKLGVRSFIIIDNCSDDGSREYLYKQDDVLLYSSDTEYRYSHYGVVWQQAVLANHCIGKWVLLADADELLVYPGHEQRPLADVVRELDEQNYDSSAVLMVDMYPFGSLDDADFETSDPFASANWFDRNALRNWALSRGRYSNSVNYTSALRHRLMPDAEPHGFTSQKYCLLKYAPWFRLCEGLHDIGEITPSPTPLWFAHFKYHAGFKEKVETEVRRKQHFNDAVEYRKYLDLLAESSGTLGLEELSQRYEDSSSFLSILQAKPDSSAS